MNAHRIRLRAPWQSEVLDRGGVCWSRSFHRPTNLDPADRVWVVVSHAPSEGTVELNSQLLGLLSASAEARFEVAGLLADRNELAIFLNESSAYPGDPNQPTEVWLEIG